MEYRYIGHRYKDTTDTQDIDNIDTTETQDIYNIGPIDTQDIRHTIYITDTQATDIIETTDTGHRQHRHLRYIELS